MKALTRSYVCWPGLDRSIELVVRSSQTCQEHSKLPELASMGMVRQSVVSTAHRLHGSFRRQDDSGIVGACSKYIDAHVMTSATTAATILRLRQTFSTHGMPGTIVSDNNAACLECQQYCSMNGIKHKISSPYHPASNGLAERPVQTIKRGLNTMGGGLATRMFEASLPWHDNIHTWLLCIMMSSDG